MRKRITSALLTLVMLLSLVPAMGTTAAAASESHPTAVGELTKGNEACYYRIYPDGTGKTVTWLGYEKAPSDNVATNWNTFKNKIGTNYNGDTSKKIDGVAYYDQDSGTLYVKGCFVGTCTKVTPSTSWSDVLTVVVDGDTIGDSGWYVDEAKKCLKELNIEFRNNSTLTFTKLDKNNKTATILGVTGHEITGDVRDENRPVYNTGDLALTGSGTLKIDIPNDAGVLYCIRARNISVEDNVSLDIKTVGNTYTVLHGSERTVRSAAIHCYEKLNIDTTGTVNIVAEKAKPNEDDRGSFNAFSFINNTIDGRFNLVNAQSVTLKVVDKEDTFINDKGVYQEGWYNTVKSTAGDKDWTVTETADTASPFIVTMTRQATLSDLKLNVGGTSYAKGKTIPDHVVTDDAASQKLSVSFDAGPQWFTTYYLKNKVNLNARVYIHKDGEFQSNFSIAQMSFGRTNGTLGFTLDVRNPEAGSTYLEAGHTYSVYVQVSPSMNGDYLAESLSGEWTFKTVDEPEDKAITAVGLKQDYYLYEKDDGSTKYPDIGISGNSQPYKITNWGSWEVTSDSEVYTRTVTLKANDGYKFTDSTKVTAVNNDGAKPVDKVESTFDSTTGTLSVTITTYKRYTVKFLNGDGTSTGNAAQYIRKDYKATAPDWKDAPSDKVFVGWKQNLSDDSEEALLPGDQTAKITGNTTYYAVLEDAPTYDIKLTKDVPERGTLDGVTSGIIIKNTGSAPTGELTASFKINASDYFQFTNFCYNPDDEEANPTVTPGEDGKTLTIPSLEPGESIRIHVELPDKSSTGGWAPGDYGCAVQVKNNESGEKAISRIVIIKTTLAKYISVDVTNGSIIGSNEAAFFVGDTVNIKANTPGAHETFTGWAADSGKVVFEDPTAKTTQFVMPDIDDSNLRLVVTANFVTATVNGIAITQMPTKTEYEVDDHFDPDGIEVKLTYSDGTWGKVVDKEKLTFDPDTSLTTTTTSVTVKYTHNGTELVTYLPITVKKPDAKKYTVTYNPGEGTGSMTSETVTEGESFTLPTICTFNPPTGQTFDKWRIGSTDYQLGQSVDITTDTTVTAIWKELPTDGSVPLVAPPTAAGPFTYAAGTSHTGVDHSSDRDKYTVGGTTVADKAGTYTAIASLSDSSYYWTDGTQQAKLIEWTINPASQAAPTGPLEMDTRTTDSITLKAIPGVEYSMDGSYWQTSPEFTGLSSGTSYTFFARIPATSDGNYSASDAITATFYTLSGSSSSGTGSTTYTIKVLGSKNGDVTSSHKTAAKGTTVTLTVSPDKGYVLDELTVLDKNDKEIKITEKNGKYTFTMPASNVEVEATFKAAKSGNPFVDVPSGAYYEDAVIWAVEEGVTGGTSATTFNPNGICTRAQAVTFLWRAAGSPAPKSATMPFTDVAQGSYYEQAVLWAVENGITKGTSDTTFSPNATCSRAQIVTFLWRSQKSPAAGEANPFTDVKSDAYYADAVLWAVKESVTKGTTDTTFAPNAGCTRAQIVTFIYRALAK